MIKKILRLLITILLSPIIYPIAYMACSVFSMVTVTGFIIGITYPLAYLGDNNEWKDECKEGFEMCGESITLPFLGMYEYILTGKIDNN